MLTAALVGSLGGSIFPPASIYVPFAGRARTPQQTLGKEFSNEDDDRTYHTSGQALSRMRSSERADARELPALWLAARHEAVRAVARGQGEAEAEATVSTAATSRQTATPVGRASQTNC